MNFIRLSSPETQESWDIPVIFEDAELLVLNKPPRLLTSPDHTDPNRTSLMRLLHQGIKQNAAWARERSLAYLSNAHRLDFETSGALMLAKSKAAFVHVANQFGSNQPTRRYVALVQGQPPAPEFVVNRSLAPDTRRLGCMRTDNRRGKPARTRFQVREFYARFALLEAIPATTRAHQIRVHLRSLRLSVVGDSLYGGRPLLLSRLKTGYRFKADRPEIPLLARAALHVEALTLIHPSSGSTLTIEAPWPKDLTVAVKYLRRYGRPQMSSPQEVIAAAAPSNAQEAAEHPGS